jgi:hypothetical protein
MMRTMCGLFAAAALLTVGATGVSAQFGRDSEPLPSAVRVNEIPAGAVEVDEAVKSAKQGQEIVLRGRIAQVKDAFAKDRAVFTLSDDAAVAACCPKDGSLMDKCAIPATSQATIHVIDRRGQVMRGSIDKGGLKPGAEVFVVGKVAGAEGSDGLVVHATGIHVPRDSVPAGFFLRETPESAKDLSDVRMSGEVKKGDTVAVRGVIGGSSQPFVKDRAVFTLMGSALKPCSANPEDKCTQPWDYCCETRADIAANSATIRVVNDRGQPLRTDIKGRAGLKELSEVVVVGKVAETSRGALILDAEGIYPVTSEPPAGG